MSVVEARHRLAIRLSPWFGGRGPISESVDGENPDCPSCGGELDLSQPSFGDGAQLVGCCLECDRLCLVLSSEDSRQFALAEVLALLGQ
jgi:hypothetical protein